MSVLWKIITGIAVALAAVATVAALSLKLKQQQIITLEGTVILQDTDPKKEAPIAEVSVTVDLEDGVSPIQTTTSTFSGYFKLRLQPAVLYGDSITLRFRHPEHQPLDLPVQVGQQLYVVRMPSARAKEEPRPARPDVVLSDILVRYTIETRSAVNIGSGAKTFEVVNQGNIPCERRPPCSPDGKWKAADGGVSLDAGEGNEFRNARLSCVAGPCPFTRVESDEFSRGGRLIAASVRNWSDTVTFALEAEVFRPQNTSTTQRTYPIILGRGLNFTLARSAEGVSFEAEVDGAPIVFPLPPNGTLSWANCDLRVQQDQSRLYRCELKPGYVFKNHEGE